MPIPGSAGVGRPPGTSAITATPWASRSNARLSDDRDGGDDERPRHSRRDAAGATRSAASDRQPTSGVSQPMSSSDSISRHSISGTLPLSTVRPEELRQLADDDQDADPADEADEHRAGEELRDEAEPEQRRRPRARRPSGGRARRGAPCTSWAGNVAATVASAAAAVIAIVELGPTSSSRQVPKTA